MTGVKLKVLVDQPSNDPCLLYCRFWLQKGQGGKVEKGENQNCSGNSKGLWEGHKIVGYE